MNCLQALANNLIYGISVNNSLADIRAPHLSGSINKFALSSLDGSVENLAKRLIGLSCIELGVLFEGLGRSIDI